jgi:hypothetical protein
MSLNTSIQFVRGALALMTLLLLGMTTSTAQQNKSAQPQQQPGTTIRIGSEEVLLDIVVRDKKGRPVTDLKESEIEVYEDGVKQQITSFRPINRSEIGSADGNQAALPASAAGPDTKSTTPDPTRQVNLVTMVFERLNNESRTLARQDLLKDRRGFGVSSRVRSAPVKGWQI